MRMTKKTGIAILIISLLAIVLSAVSLIVVTTGKKEPVQEQKAERDIQYVMYVGTNDKDTYAPVCTPEEAAKVLAERAKAGIVPRPPRKGIFKKYTETALSAMKGASME